MDSEKLIYIAGIIDAGSYIGIQEIRDEKWTPVLRIRRSDPLQIDRITEVFPGYFGHRDGGWWVNYQGKKAAAVLRAVYPWLQTKKAHAEVIFELRKSVERCLKGKRKAFEPVPNDEKELRQRCKLRIQELNGPMFKIYGDVGETRITVLGQVFCSECKQNEVIAGETVCTWCKLSKE